MSRCFVIQPFDSGRFDKRYVDVYKPAILDAGLEPYRVDNDMGVSVPIDAIESGIREAMICLADITLDNPNVWFELGFALASGKPVVMLSGEERIGKKYPFDIQHRTVTSYQSDSPSDFANLRRVITGRLTAMSNSDAVLKEITRREKTTLTGGLSQIELVILAAAAGNLVLPNDRIGARYVKIDVQNSGFTALAFTLGIKKLVSRNFVEIEVEDYNGEEYHTLGLTDSAWEWIEDNESEFLMREPKVDPDKDDPNKVPF